jgi:hypothetical protein
MARGLAVFEVIKGSLDSHVAKGLNPLRMGAKKARDDLIAASATVSRCRQVENSAIPLYKLVLFMVYSPALLNARTDATTTIAVAYSVHLDVSRPILTKSFQERLP